MEQKCQEVLGGSKDQKKIPLLEGFKEYLLNKDEIVEKLFGQTFGYNIKNERIIETGAVLAKYVSCKPIEIINLNSWNCNNYPDFLQCWNANEDKLIPNKFTIELLVKLELYCCYSRIIIQFDVTIYPVYLDKDMFLSEYKEKKLSFLDKLFIDQQFPLHIPILNDFGKGQFQYKYDICEVVPNTELKVMMLTIEKEFRKLELEQKIKYAELNIIEIDKEKDKQKNELKKKIEELKKQLNN